jgi:2'-5' RNA ligase
MEQIRTFVAIELDRAMQDALDQIQSPLKNSRAGHIARWVSPHSIHLTLKFLGNVPVNRVEGISQAIHRACEAFAPFSICLTVLGCFPHERRPRVIWVGMGGELETLGRLQNSVETALNRLGFRPEKRGFTPHLTLARIRDRARPHERQELIKLLPTVEVPSSASMLVREVDFIRSDLRPTGAVYSRLSAVALMGDG